MSTDPNSPMNDSTNYSSQKPETPLSPETNENKWIRGLYVILFLFIGYIVGVLILAIAILQFIINIISNKPNDQILNFNASISEYAKQIIRFLGQNEEYKPFPFNPWP